MHYDHLETFVHVAEAGSFSKAAEGRFITPQAIIKQITLLENNVGLKLFERTYRGVRLTAAGQSFYRDARYMLQFSKDALERARMAMRNSENTIRVGTSLITPSRGLMELWPQVSQLRPELRLQLVPFENNREKVQEILSNLGKDIDIVVTPFDYAGRSAAGYDAMELSWEPIRWAMPSAHPLARKERLAVEDLYGENLMVMRQGWNSYADRMREGLREGCPTVQIEDFGFYDMELFNRCVETGSLLMVMGDWDDIHPLLTVRPVDWEYQIPFGILHAPQPSAQVQVFLQAAAQVRELRRGNQMQMARCV